MGEHSGKFAVVNGISTVRNWTVNDTADNKKFVASNTLFGTGRRNGVRSWNGNYNAYGSAPLVMPGELFAFAGYTAPGDDVLGSDGKIYTGDALVSSIAQTWNWQGGENLSHVANFDGHLGLSITDGVYADETDPDVPGICGLKIQYKNVTQEEEEFTDWPSVTQAVLTITAANQSYVNSSTACETGRKSGPIDFTLAVSEQNEGQDFAKGDDLIIRLFVNSEEFWELTYAKVKEFTGLLADRETGAIIARTVNLEMNGFPDGLETGSIILPGNVQWWPEVSGSSA